MAFRQIGRRLQMAREESGLSQEQLAAMMGCAQSTLSNYEKGKRRLYLSQLEKIAEILDKPIEYFIETDERNERSLEPAGSLNQVEPELLQIINSLYSLSPDRRRSVIDYISWQKARV